MKIALVTLSGDPEIARQTLAKSFAGAAIIDYPRAGAGRGSAAAAASRIAKGAPGHFRRHDPKPGLAIWPGSIDAFRSHGRRPNAL